MKKYLLLILTLFILLSGCSNANKMASTQQEINDMHQYGITKALADEIRDKLGYEMVLENTASGDSYSYLVKGDQKVKLGGGFGGIGIESGCLADLDKDLEPELFYFYSGGSGLKHTYMSAFCKGRIIKSNFFSIYNGFFFFKKSDDQNVYVYTSPFNTQDKSENGEEVKVGKIQLTKTKDDLIVSVKLDDNLPSKIKDSIDLK